MLVLKLNHVSKRIPGNPDYPTNLKDSMCNLKVRIASADGREPLVSGASGGRLNKKDGLTRYGDSHVKDKTS